MNFLQIESLRAAIQLIEHVGSQYTEAAARLIIEVIAFDYALKERNLKESAS